MIIDNTAYSVNKKILTSNYSLKNPFLLKIKKLANIFFIDVVVPHFQRLASSIVVRFINLEAIYGLACCWFGSFDVLILCPQKKSTLNRAAFWRSRARLTCGSLLRGSEI
jgi:hypothetical protein